MEPGASAPLFAPLLAGIVSITVMVLLLKSRNLAVDKPNERSLHTVPVPRTGGIAIMAGTLAAAIFLNAAPSLVIPASVLALVSYFDDRRALPAVVRLVVHLAVAGAFLWMSGIITNIVLAVLLMFAIGWLTNLYNFMDGSDGLAGGMAVIGFGAYGVAAWMTGMQEIGLLAWAVAAAAAGFLIFNFAPARIFMGDVGSIPLGFLAGAIGVAGWQQAAWPLWFPLVVFAPFIVDASLTLGRRLLRGERVWQAHRQHYYQRLILSGWSHRKTALLEYALMILCGAVALYCLTVSGTMQLAAIAVLAVLIGLAMWAADSRWKRFSAGSHG